VQKTGEDACPTRNISAENCFLVHLHDPSHPGFVVLGSGEIPLCGINVFGNGFLLNIYQPSFLYPERPEPLQDVTPSRSPD